jgi:hypothetical protein
VIDLSDDPATGLKNKPLTRPRPEFCIRKSDDRSTLATQSSNCLPQARIVLPGRCDCGLHRLRIEIGDLQ